MSELRTGDTCILRKLKYRSGDLWLMWEWDEPIWHVNSEFLVGTECPGKLFTRPDTQDKPFIGTRYALLYLYFNEPFYFYELYAPEPPYAFESWYCNLNTVPIRTDDGYSFIDIDLDIWVYPDLTYEIVDEDEYREHSVKYQYPDELKQTVETAMARVLKRLERVVFPFRPNVKTLPKELVALAQRFNEPLPALERPILFPEQHAS